MKLKKIWLCLFMGTLLTVSAIGGSKPPSTGLAPRTTGRLEIIPEKSIQTGEDYWYGFLTLGGSVTRGWGKIPYSSPDQAISLAGDASSDFPAGATFARGKWYALMYESSNFLTVDTANGDTTILRTISPLANHIWTGLTYDPVKDSIYAVSTSGSVSVLYQIDEQTGLARAIGNPISGMWICLAADTSGQMYTIDIGTDQFIKINKDSATAVNVGSIGFNANYAEDMEFDPSTNICYFAGYDIGISSGVLVTVDVLTGATTKISNFVGNDEFTGLAIPPTKYQPVSIAGNVVVANDFSLGQCFPNPFNPVTTITYQIPASEFVTLTIFDITGKEIKKIVNERQSAGLHRVAMNAHNLVSGIYFYRLEAGTKQVTKKMILMK